MASLQQTSLFVLTVTLQVISSGTFVPEGSRVLARTSNSIYYYGNVTESKGITFLVTLDSGDQMEYSYEDRTAVLLDSASAWVSFGDHVIAISPLANMSQQYLIGFVSGDFCQGDKELYEITFDNNHHGNFTLGQMRKFRFFDSIHQVGARVFARWTDNLYYRGFVKETFYRGDFLYIDVQLDHSNSISHKASDERAIVLDTIPPYSHVHATQRVIGYFPGFTSYLPGMVVRRNKACWEAAYHVKFDTGNERDQDFNEIRVLPPYVQLAFFP